MKERYKGYKIVTLDEESMAEFYESGQLENVTSLLENEYLLIANTDGEIVDKYINQDSQLHKITHTIIDNNWYGTIKPRNLYQLLAINLLNELKKMK